jgi:hypothetical protein
VVRTGRRERRLPKPVVVDISASGRVADLLGTLVDQAGHHPVLVIVGGAAGLDETSAATARALIERVVLPAVVATGSVIVDGGTDSGVMRILGDAHRQMGLRTALIGVAVRNLVRVPCGRTATSRESADANPDHTHLMLIDGNSWGDESPWLAGLATVIAAGSPTATLVINGGRITVQDVAISLSLRRAVLLAEGTGRLADSMIRDLETGNSLGLAAAHHRSLVHVLRSDESDATRLQNISALLGGSA